MYLYTSMKWTNTSGENQQENTHRWLVAEGSAVWATIFKCATAERHNILRVKKKPSCGWSAQHLSRKAAGGGAVCIDLQAPLGFSCQWPAVQTRSVYCPFSASLSVASSPQTYSQIWLIILRLYFVVLQASVQFRIPQRCDTEPWFERFKNNFHLTHRGFEIESVQSGRRGSTVNNSLHTGTPCVCACRTCEANLSQQCLSPLVPVISSTGVWWGRKTRRANRLQFKDWAKESNEWMQMKNQSCLWP